MNFQNVKAAALKRRAKRLRSEAEACEKSDPNHAWDLRRLAIACELEAAEINVGLRANP